MDRRHFCKTVLFSSLFSPFLASFKVTNAASRLYLITDTPQRYLPLLIGELRKNGLVSGRRFSLLNSSPFDEELLSIMSQTGWKSVSPPYPTDFSISFGHLHQKVGPSFSFVKQGRIYDIRSKSLVYLWLNMKESQGSSSFLTIASFQERKLSLLGRFVSVYRDGRKIGTLDLKNKALKSYSTQGGHVIVKVENGKASVLDSSCPQRICCFSPSISLAGERIICAPNHFLLEVERTAAVDTAIG